MAWGDLRASLGGRRQESIGGHLLLGTKGLTGHGIRWVGAVLLKTESCQSWVEADARSPSRKAAERDGG